MKPDLCPVCQSRSTVEWYAQDADVTKLSFNYTFTPESRKTFRVVRCRSCTHAFCSPIPKNIYKNYEDVVDEEYLRHKKTRELTAEAVLKVIKNYMPSGTLLDVGCATGDFLSQAKNVDYSAEGLELSRWSSEIARKRGFKIYRETLQSLSGRYPKRYDIVTLWGVIEHFADPGQEMAYINKLLKRGGLVALWTGDVNSIVSRLFGRRWWYWQGQHIQYFARSSLKVQPH